MAYIAGMKRLICLAVICGLGMAHCALRAEEAVGGTPAATRETRVLPDLKLKVRWTEKKSKDGKRLVTIFVKNEGMNDLKDVPAEIVLKGKTEKERQTEKITLTVPRNQEKGFDVAVLTADADKGGGGLNTLQEKPFSVKELVCVEVVMGEVVFASR
jgi:hypothetical protein